MVRVPDLAISALTLPVEERWAEPHPLPVRSAPCGPRVAAGLTQVDVAKALGRPQSFVTKCELGERRIDPIELQTFAALYRKRLAYFLPPVERR